MGRNKRKKHRSANSNVPALPGAEALSPRYSHRYHGEERLHYSHPPAQAADADRMHVAPRDSHPTTPRQPLGRADSAVYSSASGPTPPVAESSAPQYYHQSDGRNMHLGIAYPPYPKPQEHAVRPPMPTQAGVSALPAAETVSPQYSHQYHGEERLHYSHPPAQAAVTDRMQVAPRDSHLTSPKQPLGSADTAVFSSASVAPLPEAESTDHQYYHQSASRAFPASSDGKSKPHTDTNLTAAKQQLDPTKSSMSSRASMPLPSLTESCSPGYSQQNDSGVILDYDLSAVQTSAVESRSMPTQNIGLTAKRALETTGSSSTGPPSKPLLKLGRDKGVSVVASASEASGISGAESDASEEVDAPATMIKGNSGNCGAIYLPSNCKETDVKEDDFISEKREKEKQKARSSLTAKTLSGLRKKAVAFFHDKQHEKEKGRKKSGVKEKDASEDEKVKPKDEPRRSIRGKTKRQRTSVESTPKAHSKRVFKDTSQGDIEERLTMRLCNAYMQCSSSHIDEDAVELERLGLLPNGFTPMPPLFSEEGEELLRRFAESS